MAGRGRGSRMLSFSVDSFGLSRDSLPPAMQQPTPVFPVMEQKPLPLVGGEEADYLLALKQDFRAAMRTLPFFIRPAKALRGVSASHSRSEIVQPALVKKKKKKKKKVREKEAVLLKLETLEKKEEQQSSEEEGEERKKQEEGEEEEEYDEEEFEEETDYIMSYFDNGEEFGGDSDENMDEAIY
ncbi:DNA-directed RNA polymerase III subunit RPC7-like [Xenentodon cancila]